MESKNVTYVEAENINLVTRGWNMRKAGQGWSEGTKWQLCRMNKSKDLMYPMMTIVNNTVLNIRHLLRQ